jgi:hypothetical protein
MDIDIAEILGDIALLKQQLIDAQIKVGGRYYTDQLDTPTNKTTPGYGTWELADKGRFAVGFSGTSPFTAGSTGGSKDMIVPYHNHGFTGTQATITHSTVTSGGETPAHSHSMSHAHSTASSSWQTANHTHTINHNHGAKSSSSAGAHTHSFPRWAIGTSTSVKGGTSSTSPFSVMTKVSDTTGSGGGHTHSVDLAAYSGSSGANSASHYHTVPIPTYSGNTGSANPAHTHTFKPNNHTYTPAGTVANAGTSGNLVNTNLPPYKVLYVYRRTA